MGTAFLMGQHVSESANTESACLFHDVSLWATDYVDFDETGGVQIDDDVYLSSDDFYYPDSGDGQFGSGEREAFWSDYNGRAYLVRDVLYNDGESGYGALGHYARVWRFTVRTEE